MKLCIVLVLWALDGGMFYRSDNSDAHCRIHARETNFCYFSCRQGCRVSLHYMVSVGGEFQSLSFIN